MKGQREYLLYLYAESPVHAGAADSQDVLDLPIQRESSTGYPVVWGQSLKGALRQAARDSGEWDAGLITDLFGPEVTAAGEGLDAGRLVVGDAQLVAMPVATLRRTFAWITTELALARLSRKYSRLGVAVGDVPVVAEDRAVAVGKPWAGQAREVLGPVIVDITPDSSKTQALATWARRIAADGIGVASGLQAFSTKAEQDLLLVGTDLAGPLLRECTEIAVRVQLGDGKTVENGPFHTEYLPAETVLAASLTLRPPKRAEAADKARPGTDDEARERLTGLLDHTLLQIGGDETIGKGLVWSRLHGGRS